MKPGFIALLAFILVMKTAIAQHSLQQLWHTDSILAVPESVLYDGQAKLLYVSLINGASGAKDGKGGVAKLGLQGTIIDSNWITGLNAPKGLGKYGNNLYVADLDEVVVIDIAKGAVTRKISLPGTVFLNDITVDAKGNVYVSDTRKNKVFRIGNGAAAASLYIDNVDSPNGLLAVNDDLYVLSAGNLLRYNAQQQVSTIATGMEKSTDGLVQVAPGTFIASSWVGVVYYLQPGQLPQTLIDTRAAKKNTADIEYNADAHVLYVPTFNGKSVDAYTVKQ